MVAGTVETEASFYIHHLNPVIVHLGRLSIHWYGLAYVVGFMAVIVLLRYFARLGTSRLPESQVTDFVTYGALFGVLLGGRLGYFLFGYGNLGDFASDPLLIFRLNEGGMASHGGILGLFLFTLWYSRRHKIPWTNLGDHLVVGAPVGLFFGRLANFVNGELYGRAAQGVAWAMKFPAEISPNPANPGLALTSGQRVLAEKAALAADPSLADVPLGTFYTTLIERMRNDEALRESVGRFLTPRHPSQLYEAALEGLALFLILFFVRVRFRRLPNGVLTGLFFLFYAGFRIFVEQFREPDSDLVGLLTKGQFYSLFMVIIGAAFLLWAWRHPQSHSSP